MNQLSQLSRLNSKLPLEDAFQLFNEVSQNLTEAYQLLERQVGVLSQELAKMHSEKVQYLSEKEQLAYQLEALVDVLPGAVVVLNQRSIVVRANALARLWLDANLVGNSWLPLKQAHLKNAAGPVNEFVLENGRIVALSTTTLACENGCVILLSDVTEQNLQHERLEHKNKLAALGKVSASIAHQIRTPLSSALLYASQLDSKAVTNEKRDGFTQKLLQSLRHLNSQVSDMLGYAHLGSYQKTSVTALDLIAQINLFYRSNTAHSHLELSDGTAGEVFLVAKEALVGAITNLIDNALEATGKAASTVTCSFKVEAGQFVICVKDQAKGISEEQQKHLFEPFYTTKAQGTGLGLAVVSEVAKNHQGRAFCESVIGFGSHFRMSLPVLMAASEVTTIEV